MATICQTLSDKNDNYGLIRQREARIWKKVLILSILMCLIKKVDLSERCDVLDEWPVAHPFLLFGALQTNNENWLSTWAHLEHFPVTDEVVRNLLYVIH